MAKILTFKYIHICFMPLHCIDNANGRLKVHINLLKKQEVQMNFQLTCRLSEYLILAKVNLETGVAA